VPALVRQALNIESGLNDGLALPFFVLALAAAAEAEHVPTDGVAEVFLRSLVLAAVIGAIVGWLGPRILVWSRDRGWVGREWSQIGTLALVAPPFSAAEHAGGSGFIATWVAGVVFGRVTRGDIADAVVLTEDLGGLLATVSFLGFGAILLGPVLGHVQWQIIVYAVLSLIVIRLVPVAISLVGSGFARPTFLFMGWFGPRGLASIVFGLFVAEEALPNGSVMLDTVFVTVALSVILHGVTVGRRTLRPLVRAHERRARAARRSAGRGRCLGPQTHHRPRGPRPLTAPAWAACTDALLGSGYLTAFFTRSAIFFSSAGVSSFSA